MGLELKLCLAQRQELALVLPDSKWLKGRYKDLITLLEGHPQVTDDGLHYLISGGWAVEIITGKKRKHHDLDVINLSGKGFHWLLDEQSSKDYFSTISIDGKYLFENHSQIVPWDASKHYNVDKKWDIYMPSNEFLFLSKIIGFLRAPREKDLFDLEHLAHYMNPKDDLENFYDLLNFIPGMNVDFEKNDKLFKDIGAKLDSKKDTKLMAATYICEIIENFSSGKVDYAKKQSLRIYDVFKNVYETGLKYSKSTFSINDKIVNSYCKQEELDGFWVDNNGKVEFRILGDDLESHVTAMKIWNKFPKLNSVRVDIKDFFLGKENEHYLLFKNENLLNRCERVFIYGKFDLIFCNKGGKSSSYDFDGKLKFLLENEFSGTSDLLDFLAERNDLVNLENVISEFYKKDSSLVGKTATLLYSYLHFDSGDIFLKNHRKFKLKDKYISEAYSERSNDLFSLFNSVSLEDLQFLKEMNKDPCVDLHVGFKIAKKCFKEYKSLNNSSIKKVIFKKIHNFFDEELKTKIYSSLFYQRFSEFNRFDEVSLISYNDIDYLNEFAQVINLESNIRDSLNQKLSDDFLNLLKSKDNLGGKGHYAYKIKSILNYFNVKISSEQKDFIKYLKIKYIDECPFYKSEDDYEMEEDENYKILYYYLSRENQNAANILKKTHNIGNEWDTDMIKEIPENILRMYVKCFENLTFEVNPETREHVKNAIKENFKIFGIYRYDNHINSLRLADYFNFSLAEKKECAKVGLDYGMENCVGGKSFRFVVSRFNFLIDNDIYTPKEVGEYLESWKPKVAKKVLPALKRYQESYLGQNPTYLKPKCRGKYPYSEKIQAEKTQKDEDYKTLYYHLVRYNQNAANFLKETHNAGNRWDTDMIKDVPSNLSFMSEKCFGELTFEVNSETKKNAENALKEISKNYYNDKNFFHLANYFNFSRVEKKEIAKIGLDYGLENIISGKNFRLVTRRISLLIENDVYTSEEMIKYLKSWKPEIREKVLSSLERYHKMYLK